MHDHARAVRRSITSIAVALVLAAACGEPKTDAKAPAKTTKAGDKKEPSKAPDAKDSDAKDPDTKDSGGKDDGADEPAAAWAWDLPNGIHVPPRVPDDNPMSKEKVELGHKLFMDKRLSVDGTRSCYSCHQNELGNADGRVKALGPGNKDLPRNTPTIWNVGLSASLYWDGRSDTLEAQGIGALKGGNMGLGDALETKAAEIGALPEYAAAFTAVFGMTAGEKVTSMHVARALSAYERTLLCGGTAHDDAKQDEAAKRGFALFATAGCVTCHSQDNFSDGLYHRTGIGASEPPAEGADLGRGKISSKPEENFAFRTPTLRNVSKTAPYFHDGSAKTLEDAVRTMAAGGVRTAGPVDSNLVDRKLDEAQQADIVAFLKSLDCPGQLDVIGDQKVDGIGG